MHYDNKQLTEGDINLSADRQSWNDSLDRETKDLLERDANVFLHQSMSTPCIDVLSSCKGNFIKTISNHTYFDFHGNSVHQLGYGNPEIISSIKCQLDELPFSPRRFTNMPAIECAEKITSLLPGGLNRVLFAPSGAAVISMAIKLARIVTGKYKMISFWDSFHGANLDTISAGGEAVFRQNIGPLIPGTEHVPPPTTYRGLFDNEMKYADYFEYVAEKEGDIGIFLAEPIRNTDVQIPSKNYWMRIREICDKYNIVLIFDEIPLALGRTGRMFAFEHFGVTPDILCLGKGLGGGVIPFAAMIAREDYNVAKNISLGHYTHEKSPLGSIAALASFDYIEKHNLLDRVTQREQQMQQIMNVLYEKYPIIGDVRGKGLLWGVELVENRKTKTKAIKQAERILYNCLKNGLSFKISQGNVIQLCPPLTISEAELELAMKILENALLETI